MKSAELTSDEAYADGVSAELAKRKVENADRKTLLAALPLVRPRAQTYVEAAEALDYFFRQLPVYDEKAVKKFLVPEKTTRLPELRRIIAEAPDMAAAVLEARVVAWLAENALELKDIAQPARVALTGRTASPGLFEVIEVLGRERTLARIDNGLRLAAAATGVAAS